MEQPEFFKRFQPPRPRNKHPAEWRVVALRECPLPETMQLCDTPQGAADYWRAHLVHAPYFNPEIECFFVLHLNTRRRLRGHHLASIGMLGTLLGCPLHVVFAGVVVVGGAL